VGEFNLSHACLTSAEALLALRQLPITNPSLHHEITGGKTSRCTEDDEPVFSAETDQGDGSDIPIDVVRSVVMAEGSVVDGYKLDEEGSIVRTGVAENEEQQAGEDDAEASVIVPAAELGRGRRVKISSKRFKAEWEEH
jgi:hypothetical protein